MRIETRKLCQWWLLLESDARQQAGADAEFGDKDLYFIDDARYYTNQHTVPPETYLTTMEYRKKAQRLEESNR